MTHDLSHPLLFIINLPLQTTFCVCFTHVYSPPVCTAFDQEVVDSIFPILGPFRSTKICWMSKIKGLKTLLVPFSTQKGLIGLGSAQSPHKVLLVLGINQYQCCLSFLLSITRYCFQSPLKNIYLSK